MYNPHDWDRDPNEPDNVTWKLLLVFLVFLIGLFVYWYIVDGPIPLDVH